MVRLLNVSPSCPNGMIRPDHSEKTCLKSQPVPIPQKAILAIDIVNHAVAAGEDVLEVPTRADFPIRRLCPLETAVATPIVPIPQKAILAIDIVNHAVATGEDVLEVPARANFPIRRLGPPEAAIDAPIVLVHRSRFWPSI
jgi:hypothetical protein